MPRPDTFLVGAPKCGTTAMCRYLEAHPDIFLAERKDLHFFGSDLGFRGREPEPEASYLARFEGAGPARRVGEASVWYLYSSKAAEEIAAFAPDARIVVMLRNPVEVMHALHSQFLLNGLGDEDIEDFADALAAEPDRLAGRRIPPHNRLPETLQYRRAVRFSEQVARYHAVFGRDRVHVLLQDDLKEDTAGAYRDVLSFLEVDASFQPDLGRVNTNKVVRSKALRQAIALTPTGAKELIPRGLRGRLRKGLRNLNSRHAKRPPLDPMLRRRLTTELLPELGALEEIIGRDLGDWKEVP